MSLNLLRECKSAIKRDIELTTGDFKESVKRERRLSRPPEPEDALKEFGIKPSSKHQASDYLMLRGISNISVPMLARQNDSTYNTIHRLFRKGHYNEIDAYIEEYKKDHPDWRLHTKPYQSDSARKRIKTKIILTDEQKKMLIRCPTISAYFKYKGVGNISIKDVYAHCKISKSQMEWALKSGNFQKIDDAIENFKTAFPDWKMHSKKRSVFM